MRQHQRDRIRRKIYRGPPRNAAPNQHNRYQRDSRMYGLRDSRIRTSPNPRIHHRMQSNNYDDYGDFGDHVYDDYGDHDYDDYGDHDYDDYGDHVYDDYGNYNQADNNNIYRLTERPRITAPPNHRIINSNQGKPWTIFKSKLKVFIIKHPQYKKVFDSNRKKSVKVFYEEIGDTRAHQENNIIFKDTQSMDAFLMRALEDINTDSEQEQEKKPHHARLNTFPIEQDIRSRKESRSRPRTPLRTRTRSSSTIRDSASSQSLTSPPNTPSRRSSTTINYSDQYSSSSNDDTAGLQYPQYLCDYYQFKDLPQEVTIYLQS